MPDYAQFTHGLVNYPLATSTGNALLRDADPAVFYVIDYFQSVLNTYLGARMAAELSAAGVTNATKIVGQVVPYDPQPWMTEQQFQFPLLAVYRKKDKYNWKVNAWMENIGEWGVSYVLPPLSSGQAERILPIFNAVCEVLLNRIENMFDPSYNGGVQVWKQAGLEELYLDEATFGWWAGAGNLSYPAIQAKLVVKERDMPPPAGTFQTFGGVDFAEDLDSPTDPRVSDFVDVNFSIIQPSSITGLSLWLATDSGIVAQSDGVHLSTWTDQSATPIVAQGLGTATPTIQAGMIKVRGTPKAFLRFDGVSSYVSATSTATANDAGKTYVILGRLGNTANRQTLIAQTLVGDTGAHTIALEANTQGTIGGRYGLAVNGSYYDLPAVTDTGLHVWSLRVNATTATASIASNTTARLDGVVLPLSSPLSGTGLFQGMATANLVTLGRTPGVSGTTLAGDIPLALVFNAALSDADLKSAETYCRQWAGLI